MAKLHFKIAELMPILAHAEAAATHSPATSQLFDKRFWKANAKANSYGSVDFPGINVAKLPKQLFLVKDSGAYLMSGASERQARDDGSGCMVTYAKGCNPKNDEDCWENSRALCGGDDFAEALPVAMFRSAIALNPTGATLVVTLLKRSIRMEVKK